MANNSASPVLAPSSTLARQVAAAPDALPASDMPPPAKESVRDASSSSNENASEKAAAPSLPRSSVTAAANAAVTLTPEGRKLRVLILSSDTGGGHRASAAALRTALESRLPGAVKVNVVDFWVELAGGAFSTFPSSYAFMAKHPWLWKMSYELTRFPPIRAATETAIDTFAHERVRQRFADYAPDLIISVHPLVNTISMRVLSATAAASGRPRVPYVTVVTDLGSAHPTWFHPDADMTYVPSPAVAAVAARCSVPETRVRTIGLPVRRDFWHPPVEKQALRAARGLLPDAPAVLLCGGGDGVGRLGGVVRFLARRLSAKLGRRGAQLVVVCGSNTALADSLRSQNWPLPVVILGYVTDMGDWMASVDLICTKAGPGTIAESLIRGLPMMLTSYLPGQEEGNVRFVLENKVGDYAARPRRIANVVARWLADPALMRDMSARAKALGKPRATEQIASHILMFAAQKRARDARMMENQQRRREAQDALVRSEMTRLALGRQHRHLLVSPAQSHLLFHLRGFLKFAVGAVLARDALGLMPGSTSLFRGVNESSFAALALRGGSNRRSITMEQDESGT